MEHVKFAEVKYSKRVNLGNYESEEVGVVAVIEEGVDVQEAIQYCKDVVAGKAPKEKTKESPKKPQSKKATGTSTASKKQPSEKTEEKEEPAPPVEEKKAPAKKAPAKRTRAKKVKVVEYDRTSDSHKKRISSLCADVLGDDWRQDKEVLKKVKEASMSLAGTAFLGEDGELVDGFVKEFSSMVQK